ncbi:MULTISPECIES: polysaccharide deacetylase family protein [Anaerotruncus]|jgi:peptidoglycan-N-acetylmuramic acid deacetylase|uniref:polysaccharide deacetylase family protein n=1 Tax=Anaerotruncus TaxID=244127 RepID=UPI0008344FB5|nr:MULTISPECIES: polysaccharide deacetylase family protein [Anaerotruncus]RGX55680.1 polysaccharide deacetylase [Anaerotruncus sp. AF02-27]
MKAFVSTALALALIVSMAACTSRKNESPSSSVAPSSSAAPSSSIASSLPSSSHAESGLASDLESGVDEIISGAESLVTPTMSTDFDKIGALDPAAVTWGPGVQVDPETNRTTACEQLQEKYGKYNAYFIAPAGSNKFYLTFDEGYENGYTPAILDVLKEKGVSAVFFVTGDFVRSNPELVQRMIDEGHVVGNHTNHHKVPVEQADVETCYQDIKELHDLVAEQFGYDMYLYRPPQGLFSEQTLAMVQDLGYTTVLWSFAYADWDPDKQMGSEAALQKTTKMLHDGGIYLLHAVSKDNAAILGELIDEAESRGMKICKWDLPVIEPDE